MKKNLNYNKNVNLENKIIKNQQTNKIFLKIPHTLDVIAGGPSCTVIIKSIDSLFRQEILPQIKYYLPEILHSNSSNIAHSCMNSMNVVWHGGHNTFANPEM